jgi:hypothetical protein
LQSISNTFKLNFTHANPVAVVPMEDLEIYTQKMFEYKVQMSNYVDPANQPLFISSNIESIPALAGWLKLSEVTWSLYGVPPASAVGTYTITLTIYDEFTGVMTDDFKLKILA